MKQEPSSEEIVEAFLAYTLNRWSHDRLFELIRKEPEKAWEVILRLVELAPDEKAAAFVAAGPLEEFVVTRGAQFLEAISTAARGNPKLCRALGCVWGESRMPVKVWKQIQKLANST